MAVITEPESTNVLEPTLVRASAGTGKTYQLTARLLRILLQGSPVETVLATTFTRKAAGEILTRVLSVLANACDEQSPEGVKALTDLREQVQLPNLQPHTCRQLLHKIVANVHRLRICTLDSLFTQLARSFPFELGLPPAWRLTDDIEEVWIKERAIKNVVSVLTPSEMTTILTMLGKGEIKRSVERELIQVVDYAYDLQRRSDESVWHKINVPKLPNSETLFRAAIELRAAAPRQKTVVAKFALIADAIEAGNLAALVEDRLIINIAKARRSKSEIKLGNSKIDSHLDESLDLIYQAVRSYQLGLVCAQNEATANVLTTYDHHVTNLKQSLRALGFSDVAFRLSELFSSVNVAALENRMDGAIDHMLLDEFQDTSPAQWSVLRPLARRACDMVAAESEGKDFQTARSFFCVGDTKQAIYGWRGGVAEIFDCVTDEIDGIKEKSQNKSFRSSPVVIDFVNRLFDNLHQHPLASPKDGSDPASKSTYEADAIRKFSEDFPSHEANQTDLPGYVELSTCPLVKGGDADSKADACYTHAAELVAKIHSENPEQTIGVLTRTNDAVAKLMWRIESHGIEVSQEGGNPLTDSAAVETVLSALMMAEHPSDGRWKFHVDSTLLDHSPELDGAAIRVMISEQGLAETVNRLASEIAGACGDRDRARLRQLVHLAIAYETNPTTRLRDFVRLVRVKRIERSQRAKVRVMTVHQAKGLEFDSVVLAQLDGQLTRSSQNCTARYDSITDPPTAITRYVGENLWHFFDRPWQFALGESARGSMTEALCLLYVAITRAKQSLYMIIQPATNKKFNVKTPASMIFHALDCEVDPTQGDVLLFSRSDVL